MRPVNDAAKLALDSLMEGNQRFCTGESGIRRYRPEDIAALAKGQKPKAAILACSDGRVTPEIIFDQALGSLFVSRVPGNVASNGAKWMLEIAVRTMHVPLVLVVGHTDCLAVGQVVRGEEGPGGELRDDVRRAVRRAEKKDRSELLTRSIHENALQTVEILERDSLAVRDAIRDQRLSLRAAVYDVHTGRVELIH